MSEGVSEADGSLVTKNKQSPIIFSDRTLFIFTYSLFLLQPERLSPAQVDILDKLAFSRSLLFFIT